MVSIMRRKAEIYAVNRRAGRRRYWVYRIYKHRVLRFLIDPFYAAISNFLAYCGWLKHVEDLVSGSPSARWVAQPSNLKSSDLHLSVMPTNAPARPKLVLLRADHVGDFLYSLPSFLKLIDAYRATHDIEIVIDPCNAELAEQLELFDRIHVFPLFNGRGQRCLPSIAEYKGLRERLGPIDCLIDLKPDKGSYFLIDWLAAHRTYRICSDVPEVKATLGAEQASWVNDDSSQTVWWYYSQHLTGHRPRFIFEFTQAVMDHVQNIDKTHKTQESDLDRYILQAHELLAQHFPRISPLPNRVALCLEARDSRKAWSNQESEKLLHLLSEAGIQFDLIGQSPARLLGSHLAQQDRRGSMRLLEVFHYLSQITCYVGFDSGLAHFCALRGIPTICIYTAKTSPAMWQALSANDNLTVLAPKHPIAYRSWWSRREKVRFKKLVDAQRAASHIISLC